MRPLFGLIFFAPFLAACGGSTANGAAPGDDAQTNDSTSDSTTSGALPCGVDSVLERNCRSCHGATPRFGAPMSLVTHGDLLAASPSQPSKKVWETVKERVHLPADAVGRMPQKPNPPLSSADLGTLDGWFASGVPERTGECNDPPPDAKDTDSSVKPLSCTPDLALKPKTKWTMPKGTTDVYVCYGVDLPVSAKRHITGVQAKIQNSKIVHHILLMQADASVSPEPTPCSEGSITSYRMLYGWAPGVGPFELPPAAGLPAESPTAHFVVQIHYNNLKGLEGETDESGFELCSTDKLRPNDADILAFGSLKFSIPPKSKHDITATWTIPSFVGSDVHVIGAFPHMHQLGTYIRTELWPKAGGGPIDLGTDASFDFSNQFFAQLGDVLVKPGDTVKTRCVWNNTTERTVSWGEKTEDEMCYSFTMYYPKIKASTWRWMAPAFLATTTVNK